MPTLTRRPARAAATSRRPAPLLALAIALLALAPAAAAAGSGGSAEADAAADLPRAAVRDARLVEEGTRIVLSLPGGEATFGIEAWRAWARRHLADAVHGPLAIGPAELGVDDVRRFGVAVASPDGERVLFSATAYALLTTLSLVGVLDTGSGTIEMRPEPRMGDLEAVTWSPDGRHAAYALGTARAGGETLRIDPWHGEGAPDDAAAVTLTRQAMLAAWRAAGLPDGADVPPDRYMPRFRDLAWSPDGERLSFTVDAPGAPHRDAPPAEAERVRGAPPMRWSIAVDGTGLRPEGRTPGP